MPNGRSSLHRAFGLGLNNGAIVGFLAEFVKRRGYDELIEPRGAEQAAYDNDGKRVQDVFACLAHTDRERHQVYDGRQGRHQYRYEPIQISL